METSGHKFCVRDTKLFLILFKNILCLQQMFPSLGSMETQHSFARPRNIMSNNVSATMCPRLPVPLQYIRGNAILVSSDQTPCPLDKIKKRNQSINHTLLVCFYNISSKFSHGIKIKQASYATKLYENRPDKLFTIPKLNHKY